MTHRADFAPFTSILHQCTLHTPRFSHTRATDATAAHCSARGPRAQSRVQHQRVGRVPGDRCQYGSAIGWGGFCVGAVTGCGAVEGRGGGVWRLRREGGRARVCVPAVIKMHAHDTRRVDSITLSPLVARMCELLRRVAGNTICQPACTRVRLLYGAFQLQTRCSICHVHVRVNRCPFSATSSPSASEAAPTLNTYQPSF